MKQRSLKSAGLRPTLPRRLILNILENSPERHIGAEDIYQAIRDADQDVGLATVYRVLTQFEQSGIVISHKFAGDNKAYYELNDESHHDHIVCVECGRVFEFVDEQIEQRQKEVAKSAGFVLEDHSLHLYGICEGMRTNGECSKTEPSESIFSLDETSSSSE